MPARGPKVLPILHLHGLSTGDFGPALKDLGQLLVVEIASTITGAVLPLPDSPRQTTKPISARSRPVARSGRDPNPGRVSGDA
jgi:hypothetical protein